MNWIKGLVAPPAFGGGQQQGQPPQYGGPQQYGGGPPMGGDPYNGGMPGPYGAQPGQMPMGQPPVQQPPQQPMIDPNQWSTGTKTVGGGGAGNISGSVAQPPTAAQQQQQGSPTANAGSPDRITHLETRIAELQHDCLSLALFARTLLTMLEDNKTVTRDQFMETKNRLDMLDGKMDDQ